MAPKFSVQPKAVSRQATQNRQTRRPRLQTPGPPVFVRSSVTPSPQAAPPPPKRARLAKAQCPNPTCSNPRIEETEDGNLICANCQAMVEEDSQLVSDQQFDEGANGRIVAQGTRVALDQTHQKTYGAGPAGKEPTPSRQKAEQIAKRKIASFSANLRIHDPDQATAMRIFGIAYGRFFYRGRTIEDVALVCLYLAVRKATIQEGGKKRPKYTLMLIDFADEEQMNVFALGKMYTALVQTIYLDETYNDGRLQNNVELLAHGPEVLVDRFVDELDFDIPDKPKIKRDAIKIVQRMSRDWMHYGRRPSGLCGAAVILAARMNNYRRTTREVVLVAKVCEITINKRLEEFKDTESSALSVAKFRDDAVLDAIPSANPPSFDRKEKLKKKRGRKRKNAAPETAAEIEEDADVDPSEDGSSTNAEGEDGENTTTDGEPSAKRPRIDAEGFAIPDIPRRSQPAPNNSNGASSPVETASPERDQTEDDAQSITTESSPATRTRRKKWKAGPPSADELALEARIQHDLDEALEENERTIRTSTTPATETSSVLTPPSSSTVTETPTTTDLADPPPSLSIPSSTPDPPLPTPPPTQFQDLTPTPKPVPPTPSTRPEKLKGPAVNTSIGNTSSVSLSPTIRPDEFDDDPDVATCLLDETEKAFKETVWVTENADWLRQDHAKKIRKQLRDAELRAQGLDPEAEDERRKKGLHVQRRKDGMRRAGRLGDVRYLEDMKRRKGAGGAGDEDGPAGGGEAGGEREGSVISAADSVTAMLQTRGYASRRIDYQAAAIRQIYAMDEESSETGGESTPKGGMGDNAASVASGVSAASRRPSMVGGASPVGTPVTTGSGAKSPSTPLGARKTGSAMIFRPTSQRKGGAANGERSTMSIAAERREARKKAVKEAERRKTSEAGSALRAQSEASSVAESEAEPVTGVAETEGGVPAQDVALQAEPADSRAFVRSPHTATDAQTARQGMEDVEDDEDEDNDDDEEDEEEGDDDEPVNEDIEAAFSGSWKPPLGSMPAEERVDDE